MVHIHSVVVGSPVGQGVGGARTADLGAVVKPALPEAPWTTVNEVIAAELGRRLGLPVPPCFVRQWERGWFFGSLRFTERGELPAPVIPQRVVEASPVLAAGIVLFDIIIGNIDRHDRNIAFLSDGRLAIFDHGHALFGALEAQGPDRFAAIKDDLAITWEWGGRQGRHCILDHLTSQAHFDEWLARFSELPGWQVRDSVMAAGGIDPASPDDLAACAEFLLERKNRVRELVDHNPHEFRGIQQPELPQ
jgi:hypothetical protein